MEDFRKKQMKKLEEYHLSESNAPYDGDVLNSYSIAKAEAAVRLLAGHDFLSAIVLLHSGPMGVRVMCDAKEGPQKLLSQFVVDDDYRLLLNDLDATPLVDANADPPVRFWP